MSASIRILFEVLVYRLRKLEMANWIAAVAVMVALQIPWGQLALRVVFGLLLNVLAYTTNDYIDAEHDLSIGRAPEKTRFLVEHRRAALVGQVVLFGLLAVSAIVFAPELLFPLIAGAGICWVYTAKLKTVPIADIGAMVVWGVSMPAVAIVGTDPLGWLLVLQLGMFSASFETIQVIRDEAEDRAAGVRTTAVLLGQSACRRLGRVFMVLSALYAILVLDRFAGALLFVVPLLPYAVDNAERYWNRVRLGMGVAWLAILAGVFLRGTSTGLLVQVARTHSWGWW